MFSKLNNFIKYLKKYKNNPVVKNGLPIVFLTVTGAMILVPINEIKYNEKQRRKNVAALKAYGKEIKTDINLEEEYAKILEADTSDYTNVRGPRPWEDSDDFLKSVDEEERKLMENQKLIEDKLFRSHERKNKTYKEYQETIKNRMIVSQTRSDS